MHRAAGMTLFEVMIASLILMVVIVLAMSAFARTNSQLTQSMVIAECTHRASQIEGRLQELLRSGGEFDLDNGDGDAQFEWLNFRAATGANTSGVTYGTQRQLRFVAEPASDGDPFVGDGVLELWEGGARLEELGRNIKSDFQIAFFDSAGGSSGGQTAGSTETELRVSFTMLGALGAKADDGSVEIYEEHRVVRITVRNN